MTIIAGIVSDEGIYVGTDSLWGFDSNYSRPLRDKFLRIPESEMVIAGAGSECSSQAMEELLRLDESAHYLKATKQSEVLKLGRALLDHLKELGVGGSKENEMPSHEFNFIIAVPGKLFTLEQDYTAMEWGDYIALGSGSTICESAIWAALKCGSEPKAALKLGLKAACKFVPNCGGPIKIRLVSPPGTSSDTPQPS